jgi:hypothetical protein
VKLAANFDPQNATAAPRETVDVKPDEIRALRLGFVFNFVLLDGYYVIRPIRDNIGAEGGLENLSWMYKALSS